IGAFQGVRSRRQPQTGEQRRLRYRAKSPRARATGDFGERGEIDMGRQIGFPDIGKDIGIAVAFRSEEHTSELQSLMRISYAVFCLKKKKKTQTMYTTYK